MTPLKIFCASPGKTIEKGSGARVAKAKKIPSVAVTNRGSLENLIIFKLINFALDSA
jgi:hypothetical protein